MECGASITGCISEMECGASRGGAAGAPQSRASMGALAPLSFSLLFVAKFGEGENFL
jgi:hypothetical protein